jgi:hypothetical protein
MGGIGRESTVKQGLTVAPKTDILLKQPTISGQSAQSGVPCTPFSSGGLPWSENFSIHIGFCKQR